MYGLSGLVCLGGFHNVRQEAAWQRDYIEEAPRRAEADSEALEYLSPLHMSKVDVGSGARLCP